MPLYKWSKTAANNATADPSVNWAEGQPPSSVNDSARAMMAATAMYRDDMSGSIVTSGTASAYTLISASGFDTPALLHNQCIYFNPHVSSGSAATLNVDGLGDKPLRVGGIPVSAGTLIAGTPYAATYNNTAGVFNLHGFYSSPSIVPLGAIIDYAGSNPPGSNFILPFGQAISRATYADLFTLIGTAFGEGDASTTFNVPDLRGRVAAGKDNMGGTSAGRLTSAGAGFNGNNLGAGGGTETVTLVTANLPPYTPTGSIANGAITTTLSLGQVMTGSPPTFTFGTGSNGGYSALTATSTQAPSTFTGTAQGGTSTAVNKTQPTLILSKIMRVI